MPISVTATVLTATSPAPVQVVVSGLSTGEEYVVVGSYGGFSWPVPGGRGTSDGSTLVLVDNRAALNCDVVYVATVDGVDYSATAVEVTHDAFCVLQSLNGATTVDCEVADPLDSRSGAGRVAMFTIAGRTDMPGRYDRGLAPSLELVVEIDGVAANNTMLDLFEAGGAIVRRNDGSVVSRGIKPVEIYSLASYSNPLIGATGALRRWSFPAQVMGDPEPGIVLVAFDLDDVKTAFTGQDLDDFKAYFAGQTLDDLRVFDWGTLL